MKKVSRNCGICDDKATLHQYHDKSCDCICHLGDGPQVSTQWNMPEHVLVSLLDGQREDSV
jgi:hypothetical protein